MSLDSLIERIERDAAQEAEQIIEEAEQHADQIIREAREQAEKEAEDIRGQGEKQAARARDKTLAVARRKAREARRQAKEDVMQDCLQQVRQQLAEANGEAYEAHVRRSIQQGKERFGDCAVLVSREVDEDIAASLDVPVEGRIDSIGGVIVKSADGTRQLDETFESILERRMGDIRILMAEHLFEEENA
ncbi:MAG: V-type ATP synthase subunit E [Thermoplasmatota archaeon]